jgi:hypothetical protein
MSKEVEHMTNQTQSPGQIEASFSTLVLSVGTQAAMALGIVANPMSNKIEMDRETARFNIDLLRTLRDKTKGNLTSEEDKLLNSMLADLQMKFVQGQ